MAAKRYSFVFYIAILVAIGTTYAVFKVLESTKASSRVATAPVVVATRDIPDAVLIDRLALTVAQWPVSTVPVGAYGSIDSVAGRVTRVWVFNGEPFVPGRLTPVGTEPGLRSKITPGKRSFPLRINDVSGSAGLIPVESRVDIALITTLANAQRTAKLFMSNMRVLGIGTETTTSADGRPIPATVAHLEVTPEEFELLLVAQAQGSIQLGLRGYGDPDSIITRGATSADVERRFRGAPLRPAPTRPSRPVAPRVVAETVTIREQVPVPAPRTARPDSSRIEVFRGQTKTEVKFQKDSAKRDTIVKN